MTSRPQPTRYSETVIRRIRELRIERGWSAQYLVDVLADAGCPIVRSTLSNMEIGKRAHVTVDELYAFAAAFGVPVDQLAHDGAVCPTCRDDPPPGFRCIACGRHAVPEIEPSSKAKLYRKTSCDVEVARR